MAYVKLKGIVTGGNDVGDADRMLSILSAEEGLIKTSAKGVRRLKNKLAGSTQLFCYGEFIMYPGKDIYTIYNCEIIEAFSEICMSPEKFTYAAHLIKIVNDIVQEGQRADEILSLLLNSLYVLNRGEKDPLLAVRIFELRLLCITGYTPVLNCCGTCGKDGEFFSVQANGIICYNCSSSLNDCLEIKSGTLAVLNHICFGDKTKLFSFKVSEEVQTELDEIIPAYLSKCFDKSYNTLDFLKLIK